MTRRFVLSGPAQRDVEELLTYVAETGTPRRAQQVHQRLYSAFRKIADMPGLGHYRDDLTAAALRFYPVWSYHIIYKPETNPVMIARVLNAARDVRHELQQDPE